jgi:hypothetical protein
LACDFDFFGEAEISELTEKTSYEKRGIEQGNFAYSDVGRKCYSEAPGFDNSIAFPNGRTTRRRISGS